MEMTVVSKQKLAFMLLTKNSHSDPCDNIGRIPKTHVTTRRPTGWRIPRHHQQINIDDNREQYCYFPRLEPTRLTWQTEFLSPVPYKIQPDGQKEVEKGRRVDAEVDNKVEGVSRWESQDYKDRNRPLGGVGTKRGTKGARGDPERSEGKGALADMVRRKA